MKQRRKEMIECAIKLFAEKGYQSTSVQDIVSEYGISKGAFYNYFSSKEELLLAIFQYYYEIIDQRMQKIQKEKLPPREIMKKQIIGQFEFFVEHRDFIVMYFREQNQSINKELRQYLESQTIEAMKNTERNLFSIYGEKIRPYICDMILTCEGIKSSYIKITVFDGFTIDIKLLSEFIMKRVDDMVRGFLEGHEEPILKGSKIDQFLSKTMVQKQSALEQVQNSLGSMVEAVNQMNIQKNKKEELLEVIQFLMNESKNNEIKPYIFQGMLSHFKGFKETELYLKEISNLLNIELL
ncbi:TetR/AcrR family transcriptional regulator [Heyndrickxia sp. NPDC080065]|uniref:TetR/AcrR family transcriptional regulator n=1 Tax=Heyndrickxia sp. NPDC080065 TaxID=3390568 RepID=UPI003CFE4D34